MIHAVLIGAGRMGRRHARVLELDPAVRLVAVVDPNLDAARAATASGCAVADVADLPVDLRPDVVIVATPTVGHVAACQWAIGRGARVLVEKPIANSVESARSLRHPEIRVGYTERFHPSAQALREQPWQELSLERVVPGEHPDPVALDLLIHDLDLLRWSGARAVDLIWAHGDHDHVEVGLRAEFDAGPPRTVRLVASRRGPRRRSVHAHPGWRTAPTEGTDGADPISRQWRAFVAELASGRRALADADEAADDVDLAMRIVAQCARTS